MKKIMISAMSSGSGKTIVTCALQRALKRRGLAVQGFKCGPDYIDPMFQRRVVGVPCRNLDLFLQGKNGVLRTLRQQGNICVLEGAMGYFDGIGGTEQGSAWDTAVLTDTPVLLVLRPRGAAVTLAAQVRGLMAFRTPDKIAGLLLNDCKESQYRYLKPILERECGIPVVGHLPPNPDAVLESRHLGLITAEEVSGFEEKMDHLATLMEEHCSIDTILSLCVENSETVSEEEQPVPVCRIAVARDAAFCFYYQENLDALALAGAEIRFFSPLRDSHLPEADAVYLGGGYPELYAAQLEENISMRKSIRHAILNGMPCVAECGGFLYLQKSLDGHAMAGALSGEGKGTEQLQRFGYLTLCAEQDSLLFRTGERIPAHEFHYWDCTDNGTSLRAEKNGRERPRCGFCTDTLYAGFPHLHFGGETPLAERFTEAALKYRNEKKHDNP